MTVGKFTLWYIRNFKNPISTVRAISLNLTFYRNVYGDEINAINCRSIWVDKKGNEYRINEIGNRIKYPMKVVCIKENSGYHLTIDKTYDATGIMNNHNGDLVFYITNDIGYKHLVDGDLFKSLEDIREEKLKQLGI